MDVSIFISIIIFIGLTCLSILIIFLRWTFKTFKKKDYELFFFQSLLILSFSFVIGISIFHKVDYTYDLEQTLKVKVPKKYELIEFKSDGFGPDYAISLKIKLDSFERKKFIKQIEVLENFANSEVEIKEYLMKPLQRDKENKMGYWIKNDKSYKYVEPFQNPEIVSCEIYQDGIIIY